MICLFLNTQDVAGIWLSRTLMAQGITNLVVVSAEELMYATSFTCGSENGKAFFTLELANGKVLSSENIHTTLNRIQFLPPAFAQRFQPNDQSYVAQELSAIFTFLFRILPHPLFNTASGRGLCGANRSTVEWLMLAQEAGFQTPELIFENRTLYPENLGAQTGDIFVIFFQGKCFGESLHLHPHLEKMCRQLGTASGENLLEISVHFIQDEYHFESATTQPSFVQTGAAFIQELKMLLQ